MAHHRIVVIVGPTAGGKSELAVHLAERFDGEIVNADSMQVYRELDAGTAKPTAGQRARVPHHLVDVAEPNESWTVADWLDAAERAIADIQRRCKLPIVVGGTNLYIKALLEGMFEGPPQDPEFRKAVADTPGPELHDRLAEVDPEAAERIHRNDHKRIVRALEVYRQTGRPISEQQQQWGRHGRDEGTEARRHEEAERATERRSDTGTKGGQESHEGRRPRYRHDPIIIGLDWSREAINRRVNQRVKQMFHPTAGGLAGREDLVTETRRLKELDRLGTQTREALGTKQVLAHLAGRMTRDEAFERTKIETRRFARKQRTWLRRFRGTHWLEADEQPFDSLVESAARIVERELQTGESGHEPPGHPQRNGSGRA
jgi:tRNA dimethylallyltransferase